MHTFTQLTSPHVASFTKFFGINHQIHEEVASLLHLTRAFTIELSPAALHMCNSLGKNPLNNNLINPRCNHARYYQSQLVLYA